MKNLLFALGLTLSLPLTTFAQVGSSEGLTLTNLISAPLEISSEDSEAFYKALNVIPVESTSYNVTRFTKSLYLKSGGTAPYAVINVVKHDKAKGTYAVYFSLDSRLLSFHPKQTTYKEKTYDTYETFGSGLSKIEHLLNASQGDSNELPFLNLNFPEFEFVSKHTYVLEGKKAVLGLSCYSGVSHFNYGGAVNLPPKPVSNCHLTFLTIQ